LIGAGGSSSDGVESGLDNERKTEKGLVEEKLLKVSRLYTLTHKHTHTHTHTHTHIHIHVHANLHKHSHV
jgi:hypothetical protein